MEITIVKGEELFNVLQQVNLLKVKLESDDLWAIAPVLYSTVETIDIIIDLKNSSSILKTGAEVILKFQKNSSEYLVSGEILDIVNNTPATVTIKYIRAQKFSNLRKHMRFDSNLKVTIKIKGNKQIESIAKNISKGGAMIIAKAEFMLDSVVNLGITFDSGNYFKSSARIIRKTSANNNYFNYGVEFLDATSDNCKIINNEISIYEKVYLKSLSVLKEFKNLEESVYDALIAIISYEADESYEIKETLVKMGAENFQVYHESRFFSEIFSVERPKVIIIDTIEFNKEINEIIINIKNEFPEIYIILVTPISYVKIIEDIKFETDRISVLYKPLIFNEFEKEIIKYL